MKVVNYCDKYREQVQKVCLLTGPPDAPNNKRVGDYILNNYCKYYIEREPENCFTLVDDEDNAVGYIICAEDFKKYKQAYKPYFEIVKNNAGKDMIEVVAEQAVLRFFSRKYPAHLHIDILDEFTGKGSGSALMKTLLSHLKSKGVKGVMLIVGSGNTSAVRVYKRNGFRVLVSAFGGTVMGLQL